MSRLPFNEAIAKNKQLPCSVNGCGVHRSCMGKYCEKHRKINNRNGHPLQRRISPAAYATERKQMEELFRANPLHSGIHLATASIEYWLTTSYPEEMKRLHRNGVTTRDILTELAAMWLYQQSNPEEFLSQEARDIALSLAVLGLAPKDSHQPFKRKIRTELGRSLRLPFEPLLVNLRTTLEASIQTDVDATKAMEAKLFTVQTLNNGGFHAT